MAIKGTGIQDPRDLSRIGPSSEGKGSQTDLKNNRLNERKSHGSYGVDLSSRSKKVGSEYKKAMEIIQATPEIRSEKVAALKEQIENGTYKPDSGLIADGILKEAIRDQLSTFE